MKKLLIIVGIVIVVGAVAGVLLWQDFKSGAATGNVQLAGTEEPDAGRGHIPVGSAHDPYKSNPPTSGPHYEQPAAWGSYDHALPDEQLIHNLEHGGIWISYKPDVDVETKAKLIDLAAQFSQSVVVTPRADNQHIIEVASWRRLLGLDTFNRDQILDFIKRNKNQSPEPLVQ